MAALKLAALALAAQAASVAAWWCDGHMLTVQVALKSGIMTAATVDKVSSLVTYLSQEYPLSPDTVSAACWADDLKASSALQEQNWHFVDLPVVRDNQPVPPPALTAETADTVGWAINQGQSTVYSSKSSQLDKARQLRFILHLVGDIHQPLHAAALFSPQFPNGDAGGNLYPVAGVDYTTELHAVWDSGAGQWVDDISRPLNATGREYLEAFADRIIAAYPVSSLEPQIKQYNVSTWANESNAIADSFVYTAPQAPTPLPASYISQAQATCLQQIALGGYRLADLLQYIFTTASEAERDAALSPPSAAGGQPLPGMERVQLGGSRRAAAGRN